MSKSTLADCTPPAEALYARIRDLNKDEAIIHLAHAIGAAYLEGVGHGLETGENAIRATVANIIEATS